MKPGLRLFQFNGNDVQRVLANVAYEMRLKRRGPQRRADSGR